MSGEPISCQQNELQWVITIFTFLAFYNCQWYSWSWLKLKKTCLTESTVVWIWSNSFLFKFQRAIKDCKIAATALRKLRHAVSSGPIETLNFLIKKQPNNVMRYSQRSGVVLTECDISLAYSKDQNNMLFSALLKPDLTNCDVMIPMQRSFWSILLACLLKRAHTGRCPNMRIAKYSEN